MRWKYLIHWDDGVTHRWDGEPHSDGPDGQSSVQLLRDSVKVCMCARCVLSDPNRCAMEIGRIPANA